MTRKLFARISDNVLNDENFPAVSIGLRDGCVAEQSLVQRGAYEAPDLIGMSEAEVLEWTRHDPTREHPEVYHELSASPEGPWSSFCQALPVRSTLPGSA